MSSLEKFYGNFMEIDELTAKILWKIDIFSKKGNVGGHDLTKICGKQDPM